MQIDVKELAYILSENGVPLDGRISVANIASQIEALNTRPAAPVEGLERFARTQFDELQDQFGMTPHKYGEYVRFDQAEAIIAAKNSEITALENLRPHWAKGYSSDSVAAQTVTAALSQLWGILGAANQTEAVQHGTAVKAKLEASEKARDDAIAHRLKANHDWRVAYDELELKLSSAEAMKNIAYAAGYYQAECGLPEHDDAKEALKDWRDNKVLAAALAGASGVPAFEKTSRFALEWLSGARPPVHPDPMVGRHTFDTFKKALDFMSRRANDSQLTGLIEHTILRAETNRTAEAQEVFQKIRAQYDDLSTDPSHWSWSKLIREKPNGLRAVVEEYERRIEE